ncbi:MAG: ATP-binding protein [Bacteroidota bacterium]|nr:ATP-binding protein [Bacteroidota bacterium]
MDNTKQLDNFEISTKWIVITGGPSSGKTTTVNQLKSLGFASSPEAARILIDIGNNCGLTIQEIRRNEEHFNQSILGIQMAVENILLPDKICFHDRGIPDSIAYTRLSGGDDSIARKFLTKRKYHKIFLLELLPFQKDYARTEDSRKQNILNS